MHQQPHTCDTVRTPFERYGGALSSIRADALAAVLLKALMTHYPKADWAAVSDVLYGCANQASEDTRNVAQMASFLANASQDAAGAAINRLCGSSLDVVGTAASSIKAGEAV